MAMAMTEENWLTVEEVAKIVRASPYTIRKWLRAGTLNGTQVGGRKLGWRISEREVNRFLKQGERSRSKE